MPLTSLLDLYLDQLRDLYDAERQLTEALPRMARAAAHEPLAQAFRRHLAQTHAHVERLEQIFDDLGEDPAGKTCAAMKGLIKEGEALIDEKDRLFGPDANPAVLDAGLIAAAQRVEHYEIAGYSTVSTYAERLGRSDDRYLLGMTLGEEKATDEDLTKLARQRVNPEAEAA